MWQVATASLSAISKEKTSRIQLFPAGWFGAPNGKGPRWFMDAALAQALIDAANLRVNHYEFDYEHQSLNAPRASGPVPAAGWFKSLSWVEGVGLFADVQWTERAASLIQADEYRYVSPTFSYDEKGYVRELINAALTNTPVLDGMQRVAASMPSLLFYDNGEPPMNENLRLALCAIFGLGNSADESAIQVAAEKLRTSALQTASCSSISELLAANARSLQEKDNQIATLSLAAGGQSVDLAQYTPNEVVDALRTDLAALSQQVLDGKIEKLMTAALSDGRVMSGADEQHLRELGRTDFALMEKMVNARTPVAALSRLQTDGLTLNSDKRPSPDACALAVCSQFADFAGIDQAAFSEDFVKEMGYGAN